MNERFIVRVWLPDLPGSLGRIATALGVADLSLVGIEIIEQGGGWAVDELVIDVDTVAADLEVERYVVDAFQALTDVRVESIVPARDEVDPRVDAFGTATDLVLQHTQDGLAETLVARARHDFRADWVVLLSEGKRRAAAGDEPQTEWLSAFLEGRRSTRPGHTSFTGTDDIAWADSNGGDLTLVIGRSRRPFRNRERAQLEALVRMVTELWRRTED